MYTATSIDVFIAAYAGCLGGMRSGRNVSQNTNPAHYVHLCDVALAFAESFDTEYASILPNDLQLAEIEAICSEQMNGRQPGGAGPTTAAFWTKPVLAIIALLSESDSVVAANVTNPIPFPSPPAGIPVIQIATVSGVADSLKSTTPATGIVAMIDGYYAKGDDGGGPFYWDTTSTATDDGGSVINPTGHVGAGRWIRIISGNRYSVRWWGAKGNGSYTTASINVGSSVATIAGLTSADIGKGIMIAGAGPSNGNPTPSRTSLTATITNVAGTNVTISTPALATVAGASTFIAANDTTALQACAAFVTSSLKSVAGSGVGILGSGGVYATLGMWFDCGLYYVTDAIACQGSFYGDRNAAIIQGDRTKNILELTGGGQTVENLAFGGGFMQIALQQSPLVNAVITVNNCTFRYPYAPAIRQDTNAGIGYDRGAAYELRVSGCTFEGQCFYFGELDQCSFRDCFLGLITTIGGVPPIIVDDGALPLGLFNAGDRLTLQDVAMAPAVDGDFEIPWIRLMGASNLTCTNVRFGGEAALPGIRVQNVTYLGQPLNYDAGGLNSTPYISMIDCAFDSFASTNWLEIFDEFPAVIDVRMSSVSTTSGPDGQLAIVASWGVWVASTVDMATIANRNKQALILHFDGVPFYSAFRFRQSANRKSSIGTDLWPFLRNYVDSEPDPYANQLYPLDAAPKNNVYVPNVYDIQQCDAAGSNAAHITTGATDYSSGYALTTLLTDGTGTQANRFLTKVLGTVANGPWGAGFAAGEYVFSCYVKANWSGRILLGRNGDGGTVAQKVACVRQTLQAGVWERLSFTFYHDGTGNDFIMSISDWPDTGTLLFGLMMVHPGTVPAPYVFPKGSATAAAAVVLPADSATGNTGLEWVGRSAYVRAADPVAGVYLKGDKIVYPEPAPLGYIGAVCTTAGGAGTFVFSKYGFIGTVDCYQSGGNTLIVNAGATLYSISAAGTWTPNGVNTDFVGAGNMRFRTSTGFCFLDAPNPQMRVYGSEGTSFIYLDANKIQLALPAGKQCFLDVPDIYLRGTGGANERIHTDGTGIGFFGSAPIAKPTITGSRAGNAALADLLTKLASYGLIVDSTTA